MFLTHSISHLPINFVHPQITMMTTNIPNRDFVLPNDPYEYDTMPPPTKKPRHSLATDASSAPPASLPIDLSGGLGPSGDSFDAFLNTPGDWDAAMGGFGAPPPPNQISPTYPTTPHGGGGPFQPPSSMPGAAAAANNNNWPNAATAPCSNPMPTSHDIPAPADMVDPDLQMEFELNTSMGMVLRPSPTQQSPSSPDLSGPPPMRPGSPSDFLDITPVAGGGVGGGATAAGNRGPGPIPGFSCATAAGAMEYRDRGANNIDQALAGLGRLDGNLRAAARMQMSLVSETDTTGGRVY